MRSDSRPARCRVVNPQREQRIRGGVRPRRRRHLDFRAAPGAWQVATQDRRGRGKPLPTGRTCASLITAVDSIVMNWSVDGSTSQLILILTRRTRRLGGLFQPLVRERRKTRPSLASLRACVPGGIEKARRLRIGASPGSGIFSAARPSTPREFVDGLGGFHHRELARGDSTTRRPRRR